LKRIILDTNVTISALFWKGYPRVIYDLVKDGKAILLWSRTIEADWMVFFPYIFMAFYAGI